MASEIKVDTISEKTSANGVTIDSLSIKDGGLVAEGNIDVNGNNLVLDANANTYLDAGTDDTIKFYVSGAHDLTISANAINVLSGTTLTIDSGATIANSGTATGFSSADPSSADGDALGTASAEWSDLYLADSSVIYFGNDQDTTLTHTDGTGLTLNSTNKICFNDTSQFIQGSSNAILSLGATDEIDLTATAVDLNGTLDVSGASTFNDDITIIDDKGITFGTGSDWHIGLNAGESEFYISKSSDVVVNLGFYCSGGGTGEVSIFAVTAGEAKGSAVQFGQDDIDDNADQWLVGQHAVDGGDNTSLYYTDYDGGSWDSEAALTQAGNWDTEGAHNASTTVDYAEFFEWKTELASDEAVTNAYGLTVVLDDDKVRLAEVGEEAKVLGVVRPNNTSAMVGGTQTFKWKDKYLTDVWGQTQYEQYTLVDWDETITRENGTTYLKHHKYHKDRIPAKELKPEIELNKSEPNWHTLESNLTADDLAVPTTDEEKAATNYTERAVYKKDKGTRKQGDPLLRKVVNPSYVFSQAYSPREERRKEWCIVGLLGQVPIRDTAVVPTHWKLMKNLESGIDLYYIK